MSKVLFVTKDNVELVQGDPCYVFFIHSGRELYIPYVGENIDFDSNSMAVFAKSAAKTAFVKAFKEYDNKSKKMIAAEEAFEALRRLIYAYNKRWTPSWSNGLQTKYVLRFHEESIVRGSCTRGRHFLAFKRDEDSIKFLENYEKLILTAKPLL